MPAPMIHPQFFRYNFVAEHPSTSLRMRLIAREAKKAIYGREALRSNLLPPNRTGLVITIDSIG